MTMNTNINDVNETRICADCGCVIETDDYYTTYDGRIICEDCYLPPSLPAAVFE